LFEGTAIGQVGQRVAAGIVTRFLELLAQLARFARRRIEPVLGIAHPLTDLPNRRAFEEAYAAQAATGEKICFAVCDIDHFKSVNDRFGHSVGDRVLKAIADALSTACKGHLVARYGGEEFAILFAGVELETARATLDTARATVAAKHYRLREDDAPLGEVTFSAGITLARSEDRYHTLFQRADQLLYAAKTAGRNCLRSD
ncbi:MAG: GGDEF domain-containing protein, partial [Sphingomonadales bacterium]